MNKEEIYYHKESMAISTLFGMFFVNSFFAFIGIIENVIQGDLKGIIILSCFVMPFLLFLDFKGYVLIKRRVEFLDALCVEDEA